MRRLFVMFAGVGLVSAMTGCYHVAGKCDCAPPIQPCCIYGLYPPAYGMPVIPPPPPPVTPGATPAAAEEPAPTQVKPAKERIGLPREL
jgi:hypothetical protein